jgi:hypothetical protein
MTLSQSGMVRHWLRLREHGWRSSLVLNGIGAAATALVVLIVGSTKFTQGAWISMLGMIGLLAVFVLIRRHYDWAEAHTRVDKEGLPVRVPAAVRLQPGGPRSHVIVPVDTIDRVTLGAVELGRSLGDEVTAVYISDERDRAEEFKHRWGEAILDVPLLIVESPYRAFVAPMLAFLERVRRGGSGQNIILILPMLATRHWWEAVLHNRDVLRLKRFLGEEPGFRVVDFTYDLASGSPVT